MTQPVLFLTVGFPGAGKTTASRLIHELTGAEHLWADHERRERFAQPTYSHQENLHLYAELNEKADTLLGAGKSVVYDTNFNYHRDRERLRLIARKHHARTFIVWVVTPAELARERATKDAHKQTTRLLGDMPVERFEQITQHLEQPQPDEQIIRLEGTHMTKQAVADALAQAM